MQPARRAPAPTARTGSGAPIAADASCPCRGSQRTGPWAQTGAPTGLAAQTTWASRCGRPTTPLVRVPPRRPSRIKAKASGHAKAHGACTESRTGAVIVVHHHHVDKVGRQPRRTADGADHAVADPRRGRGHWRQGRTGRGGPDTSTASPHRPVAAVRSSASNLGVRTVRGEPRRPTVLIVKVATPEKDFAPALVHCLMHAGRWQPAVVRCKPPVRRTPAVR